MEVVLVRMSTFSSDTRAYYSCCPSDKQRKLVVAFSVIVQSSAALLLTDLYRAVWAILIKQIPAPAPARLLPAPAAKWLSLMLLNAFSQQ